MAGLTASTKEQIVLVAERLFADYGVDGVSLRQIGARAGNSNSSAVQYHFGTKEQLIRAIFEYRVPSLRSRRRLLVAEVQPSSIRGWLECHVRAVLEHSELEESHYMSFLAMLSQRGDGEAFRLMPQDFLDEQAEFEGHLRSHLGHIDEPLRTHRLYQAQAVIIGAAAARERRRAHGGSVLPFSAEVAGLLDGTVGFLEAPMSEAARAALAAGRV